MVTYLILGVSFEGGGKPLPYWLSGDVSSTIRKVYEIATPSCRNAYLPQADTSASRRVVPLLRSGFLAMTNGLTQDE
jgi:hypothetical protein